MTLTYKYRLKGKSKLRALRGHAFAVNQVWNFCAETQRKTQRRYHDGVPTRWLSQYDLQALTKNTSKDLGLNAQTVQGVCEQFVKSRDQYKRSPKFRASSGPKKSLGWIPFSNQSRQITEGSVTYLGRTFRFFGTKRRPLPANAKGGCFVEDSLGRWWVTFHVEVACDENHGEGVIGIDLGLKTLATLSDGTKIEPIKVYRKYEEKLAVAQRAGNKKRVKRLHAKIKNTRSGFIHKVTSKLVKENKVIVVGNVSASGLARSRFAKSATDAALGMFRNQVRYKASRHGSDCRVPDERLTTQTCHQCGGLPPDRPRGIAGLGIREWRCSFCGATHDRDVNAAKNILILGLSAQPRVDESRKDA